MARAGTVNPASVILQVLDSKLGLDDRNRATQAFWDCLKQLNITKPTDITPLVDAEKGNYRHGLEILLREPDQVSALIKGLSDRLAKDPTEIRLTCTFDRVRIQIQTASSEELLSILPATSAMLPSQRLFQARAETYAFRGGEISPVERANLDLLGDRLGLDAETIDAIIARALGPYSTRQAKLEKYREVLNEELERQKFPLNETTWDELRRLHQSLGLTQDDVAPINQEYLTRIQAEITHQQQKEEAARQEEKTRLQLETAQQKIAEQQNHAEAYRQEFAAAIARTLYPGDFDRGRLEQARRDWKLDSEQVRAIEREVTEEKYGSIDSELGVDYSRLRQLLWLNQWEAADRETERLILSSLSKDMRHLEDDAISRLGCVDMQTIDALWSRYSRKKFGFVAQQRVYTQEERQAEDFLSAVGWKTGLVIGGVDVLSRWKSYRDLEFSLDAPIGHLPTWRWGSDALEGQYRVSEETVHVFFRNLVERCLPDLKSKPPEDSLDGDDDSL